MRARTKQVAGSDEIEKMRAPTDRRVAAAGLVLAVLAVLAGCGDPLPQVQGDLAFVGVNVIPMTEPGVPVVVENRTVVVTGRRIASMHPADEVEVADGTEVVEAEGMYLMPGLAEMHGHLPGPRTVQSDARNLLFLYVANGVTTVRGMQGERSQLGLRARIARGQSLGPRLFVGSPSMSGGNVATPRAGRAARARVQRARLRPRGDPRGPRARRLRRGGGDRQRGRPPVRGPRARRRRAAARPRLGAGLDRPSRQHHRGPRARRPASRRRGRALRGRRSARSGRHDPAAAARRGHPRGGGVGGADDGAVGDGLLRRPVGGPAPRRASRGALHAAGDGGAVGAGGGRAGRGRRPRGQPAGRGAAPAGPTGPARGRRSHRHGGPTRRRSSACQGFRCITRWRCGSRSA